MIETKRRCDYCGAVPALPVHYNFRRVPDGAGSSETDYDAVDLCHEHAVGCLQTFLQSPPAVSMSSEKESFARFAKVNCAWKPK